MTSFLEARALVLARAAPLAAETVPLLEAVGRVLAEDLAPAVDLPPFDTSAMDGWALRAADGARAAALPVAGFVPAGAPAREGVAPGTAVRIMTGAMIPPEADAVVPLEEAEERDGVVRLAVAAAPGQHIRPRGADIAVGEVAVRAGTVIGPAEISFLASAARTSAPVVRRPRVAVLSTGDELVTGGGPLGPGQIHDSNGPAVAAAVVAAGGIPVPLGVAPDDLGVLRARLAAGLSADALITTAGVSAGDRDLVREALAELGVAPVFTTLEVKPGHPTAFGVRGATPVFSLPGNPVSTLMMFEQLVRPALLRMQGHRAVLRPLATAVLDERLFHRGGRVTFARIRLERRGGVLHARSAGTQQTGFLRTLLDADGIAVIPAEREDAPAGTEVPVQVLRPEGEIQLA